MKLSPLLGLPYAEADDARRDFPTQVDAPRTTLLEKFTIPRFANAAARDAAIPAPVLGQSCFMLDTNQPRVWNRTEWAHPQPGIMAWGAYAASPPASTIPIPIANITWQRVGIFTLAGNGVRVSRVGTYKVSVNHYVPVPTANLTFNGTRTIVVLNAGETLTPRIYYADGTRCVVEVGLTIAAAVSPLGDFRPPVAGVPIQVTTEITVEQMTE